MLADPDKTFSIYIYIADINVQNVLFKFLLQAQIKKVVKDNLYRLFRDFDQLQSFQNLFHASFNKLVLLIFQRNSNS